MVALVALAVAGTLVPFALFAYGQSRVAPELAGAFLNLEPLVGTAAGALAFGDPFGPLQLRGRRGDPRRHRAQHDPAQARPAGTPQRGARTAQTQGGRLGPFAATAGRPTLRNATGPPPDPRSPPPPHARAPSSVSSLATRCGLPHLKTPGNSLTPHAAGGNLRIKQHPSSLSPTMTLLAPRPDRILTPHTFVVPVVRELPSSRPRLPASPPPPPGSHALLRPPTGRLGLLLPQAAGSV